jgi:hypothetical protein
MGIEYPWVEIGNGMAIRCESNGKGYDVVLRTNQTNQSAYVLLKRSTHMEQINDKAVWV